ncbi:MAG: hypothetical protein IT462_05940 [Planctomycetes bacterium]|nr:hypothetical protein [Planctomycetota bacterium]
MTIPAESQIAAGLAYQGWSGFVLSHPADGAPMIFDPSPDVKLAPAPAVFAITHGHPEHVQGALLHLRRRDREPVTVIASPAICGHFYRRSARNDDRFMPVAAGDVVEAAGWKIRVFGWKHMGLIPPECRPALKLLGRLLAHPICAARVGWQGFVAPKHQPMLGFRIQSEGLGPTVYLGEGLHRQTTAAALSEALGDEPVQSLIAGIEPEDAHCIGALLAGRAIERLMLFEPHRDWRTRFGMEQANLPELAAALRRQGFAVDLPAPTGERGASP